MDNNSFIKSTSKEMESTAKNIHAIISKVEELLTRLFNNNLLQKESFIKNLSRDEDNRKAIDSDILRIYSVISGKNESGVSIPAFDNKLIKNIKLKNQERNDFDHNNHDATPEKMWKYVGNIAQYMYQNLKNESGFLQLTKGQRILIDIDHSLIDIGRSNTNSEVQFCDIQYVIKHLLYGLNHFKECKSQDMLMLKNEIKRCYDGYRFKDNHTNKKTKQPTKKLDNFLSNSCEKESNIKTKILGYSTLLPTKNNILLMFKKDNCNSNLINNIIDNLVINEKIKEVSNIYLPKDLTLCQEAFSKIQDNIIDLIGENSG